MDGFRRLRRGMLTALVAASLSDLARADLPIERAPIHYGTAPATDPVARLQGRIDRGEVTLTREGERGYLRSVLEALGIPPSSQTLVFSKTSFQASRISAGNPRALYFGDDAYVGWVRGGDLLEVGAVDPNLGAIFYLLDQGEGRPTFRRGDDSCLLCHQSARTREVPGFLVRSVFPNRVGMPIFGAGTFTTDQESPLAERWGGWYVTGTHGDQRHMGNAVLRGTEDRAALDREGGANLTDLAGRVDTAPFLTRHSDIVALMVLEHQVTLHNLITRANFETRIALFQEADLNRALGRPAGEVSPGTGRRIASHVEALVRYLLFSGETPLTAPIRGTSGFAEAFAARGRDRRGRSLRDFDLERRIFRYPCSYLIGSEAFDALPEAARGVAYRRLLEVLTGRDRSPEFAHLSGEDRRAILEILVDTRPGLPAAWKAAIAD